LLGLGGGSAYSQFSQMGFNIDVVELDERKKMLPSVILELIKISELIQMMQDILLNVITKNTI
jgi:predicted CoA-binding protein